MVIVSGRLGANDMNNKMLPFLESCFEITLLRTSKQLHKHTRVCVCVLRPSRCEADDHRRNKLTRNECDTMAPDFHTLSWAAAPIIERVRLLLA